MTDESPLGDAEDAYYFGWVFPSRTEAESEKFDLGVRDEKLPADVVKEFEEIVAVIPRIRPTLIDFLVLRSEYAQLMGLPEELRAIFANPRFALFDAGVKTIDSHLLAERRLSAFLNAASAFRDRMLVRISGDASTRKFIDDKISELYDGSFGYRLCYNLRNFSQHRANPLHIIPVNASRNSAGMMQYQIDLELERDRLIDRESKFQSKVKAELRALSGKIPLILTCTGYYRSLQELFLAYISLSGPDIQNIVGYEAAVRRRVPQMPADATPLMFHGKPRKVEVEFKTKATSFSFDELRLLKRVLLEMADACTTAHGGETANPLSG